MPSSDRDRLAGQRALITGASAGLGRELARVLAGHGVSLVLVARRRDRLASLALELSEKTGVDVQIEALDLCEASAVQALWDRTEAAGRPIDILVNNAGVAVHGQFLTGDWQRHENVLRLQVMAVSWLTRVFAEAMVRRGRGYVVNVASIAAGAPCPSVAVYAASKSYVRHFTEALAFELRGSGVKAMSLCPGPTDTEFFDSAGLSLTAVGRLFCSPAPVVARHAVNAMIRGRSSVTVGVVNQMLMAPLALIPRAWRAPIVEKAFRIGSRKVDTTGGADRHRAQGSLVGWLESLIERSHRIFVFGRRYHPFLLMADVVVGLLVVLAAIVMSVEHLPPVRLGVVVATVILGYRPYLELKLLVSGTRGRSFLPDILLYGFPTMGLTSWALGIPIRPIADLVGLALPLLLSFGRIGCFLGGCCYGLPSPNGVRYPPIVFAPRCGRRPYAPDPDPGERVFPIQLVDGAFNFVALAALAARASVDGFDGRALPLYLLLYSAFRFFAEFFRGEPDRRFWAKLSEAQWFVILIGTAAIIALGMRP